MDKGAKPLTNQVAMPSTAYQVLRNQAADSGSTMAEVLRRTFPCKRIEQRLAAQTHVAQLIGDGASITAACRTAEVERSTFEAWRARDAAFRDMLPQQEKPAHPG